MLYGRDTEPLGVKNGSGEWISQLISKHTRARPTIARVMIVNPYSDPEEFDQTHMGKVLLWGLKRNGIEWALHDAVWPNINPKRFDAVLCWPYGFKKRPNFLRNCVEFEQHALDRGVPVINSFAGCNFSHTWCLRLWKAGSIECANYQHLRNAEDIELDYPLILRTDKLHLGLNMYLVRAYEEARECFLRGAMPPLDLAIQFIDTRQRSDYYWKWRSYVIGNTVIPRQVQLSKTWKVDLETASSCEESLRQNRSFIADGEPHPGLLISAAKLLNADIIALDYAKKPDGTYIFWEGNRNFDVSLGGEMWAQFRATTGRSNEECVEGVSSIGDAIARLILERAR